MSTVGYLPLVAAGAAAALGVLGCAAGCGSAPLADATAATAVQVSNKTPLGGIDLHEFPTPQPRHSHGVHSQLYGTGSGER